MNQVLNELRELYSHALQDYLQGSGESALGRAYEIGRRAITEGLGVLEMASIHKEVLMAYFSGAPSDQDSAKMIKMAEFLSESLSPFEMTHRGFREANVRLRLLSDHLQSIREEERARISRDIHDELGQILTCLKMDLSFLNKRLSTNREHSEGRTGTKNRASNKPSPSQPPPLREEETPSEKTLSMMNLVDDAIRAVQRISAELRPAVLDDLGLPTAIEWQVQEFQSRSGIQCGLSMSINSTELNQKRSTAIFRIFQEILTNVARHSQADRVNIQLKAEDGYIVLEVKDNGKGISEKEISDVNSLGLLGMRERALALGGEVDMAGMEGKGTRVTVRIPLNTGP